MSEAKTYSGSCHCGAVKFEVTAAIDKVMSCNCSICSRAGYLLLFVPDDNVRILAGQDAQTDYQWGKRHIHHAFCSTCGIRTMSWGMAPGGTKLMRAVNVRCLDGIDVDRLEVQKFDGRSV
jgi:hypothetical protein